VPQFRSIGCIVGNKTKLLKAVSDNDLFCRGDDESINYHYFVDSIKRNDCIYIMHNGNIVACCTFTIHIREKYIYLHGICVPIKGYGTMLINKIKELCAILELDEINLNISSNTVKPFYEKNGFIVENQFSMAYHFN
jgi:hypothetical protein